MGKVRHGNELTMMMSYEQAHRQGIRQTRQTDSQKLPEIRLAKIVAILRDLLGYVVVLLQVAHLGGHVST